MIISEEKMLHTEARNCCDYVAYDKLHNLVSCGAVKTNGKIFTGNSAALGAMATMNARRSAPPAGVDLKLV
jgi:hypothetical protein